MIDFEKDMEPEQNSDDDCEIVESTGWNYVDPTNQSIDSTHIVQQEAPILDEEPDVSTGVGAALKLAMSKGKQNILCLGNILTIVRYEI